MEELLKIRENINRKLNVSVTIGVSEPSADIMNFRSLFDMAHQAVKHKFYTKNKGVILYSEINKDFATIHVDLLELRKEVRKALHEGWEEIIHRYYNTSFSNGENYGLKQSALRALTFAIVNHLQAELAEHGNRQKYSLEDKTVVWETLLRHETIEDIKAWLIDLFEKSMCDVGNQRNSRYSAIVEDIKKIIHRDYATLKNMEQIVSPLHFSSNHANLIFKEHTGLSIFDYLKRTRMEEAGKMLIDPYYKIYEVVEKVGYTNNSYFTAAFKEYTGFSPKQYRKHMRKSTEKGGDTISTSSIETHRVHLPLKEIRR